MARKRKRCEWCGIGMTGLRRLWARYCRRCTARQFAYSIGPDVPHQSQRGEVEQKFKRWPGYPSAAHWPTRGPR